MTTRCYRPHIRRTPLIKKERGRMVQNREENRSFGNSFYIKLMKNRVHTIVGRAVSYFRENKFYIYPKVYIFLIRNKFAFANDHINSARN